MHAGGRRSSGIWRAHLEVVEAEGFGRVGVEAVAHKERRRHQGDQQDHAHPDAGSVGRAHLLDQPQASSEADGETGRGVAGETTHLCGRRRGFQRPLKDVDDPVGGQDVGVGDKTTVDVKGRLRRCRTDTLTLQR